MRTLRKNRLKIIEARRLRAAGYPPAAIADRLDVGLSTVRRWTKGALQCVWCHKPVVLTDTGWQHDSDRPPSWYDHAAKPK